MIGCFDFFGPSAREVLLAAGPCTPGRLGYVGHEPTDWAERRRVAAAAEMAMAWAHPLTAAQRAGRLGASDANPATTFPAIHVTVPPARWVSVHPDRGVFIVEARIHGVHVF